MIGDRISSAIRERTDGGNRRSRTLTWLAVAALVVALPLVANAERGRHVSRRPSKDGVMKDGATKDAAPKRAPAARPVAPPDTATQPAPAGDAAAPDAAVDAPAGAAEADAAATAEDEGPEIQTIGEEGMRAHFVDHDGPWSLHAEALPTEYLFRLWHEIGGPEVVSRTPIDRVYTISVHREPTERILERMLDGYGYTLHYDGEGRLELVRVYSPAPNAGEFKTPRLVESLSAWRDVELTASSSSAQSN